MTNFVNELVIPSLNSSEYGEGLNNVFEGINNNFVTLANHDFVKGDTGDSTEIRQYDLWKDGEYTELGLLLLDAIKQYTQEDERRPIGDITWDSSIQKNPTLQAICNVKNGRSGEVTMISSLYYMFFDGRYSSGEIAFSSDEQFAGCVDTSCLAVYDNTLNDNTGGFKILVNAFPTIYYDDELGLCWKINGAYTGLPVRGLKGDPGENASLEVVWTGYPEQDGETLRAEVTHIFEPYYGYKPLSEYEYEVIKKRIIGQSVIILSKNIADYENGNEFFFGKVGEDEDKIIAYFGTKSSVNMAFKQEEIINLFKNIDILTQSEDISSKLRGLFVPIGNEDATGQQPVHLITATGIVNERYNPSNIKTDLVISPVGDINSVILDDKHNLELHKYLYLRVNHKHTCFETSDNGLNGPIFDELVVDFSPIYKYKLDCLIKDYSDSRLAAYTDKDNIVGDPSRYLGTVPDVSKGTDSNDTIKLAHDNVTYYVNGAFTDNHLDTIPESFRMIDGINSQDAESTYDVTGLYRWVLCDVINPEIDPEALLDSTHDITLDYVFDDRFRAIFTTSITPGLSDEIMWFNGMELYTDEMYSNGTKVYMSPDGKYPIIGWTTETPFKIEKFVPVFDNDFVGKVDTTLNLNYNVNITGNESHNSGSTKKNLNVHGDINCENIKVYKLTATGEIDTVYTQNDIIGESGLKLRDTEIDYKNASGITTTSISASENIIADGGLEGSALNLTSPNMSLNSPDGTKNVVDVSPYTAKPANVSDSLYSEYVENIENNDINVTLNNVKTINIKRGETFNPYSYTGAAVADEINVSSCASDVPLIMQNNATIVVSNNKSLTDVFYYGKDGSNVYAGQPINFNAIKSYDSMCADNSTFEETPVYEAKNMNTSSYTKGSNLSSLPYIMYCTDSNHIKNMECKTPLYDTRTTYGEITSNKGTLKSHSAMNVTIPSDSRTIKEITIKFDTDLYCSVYTKSKCSYGEWPYIATDKTHLQFDVLAEVGGKLYKLKPKTVNTYKFESPGAWYGYEHGTTYGKYKGNDRWNSYDRSYTYKIMPKNIAIEVSNTENNCLYNTNKEIVLYVVPTGYIKFESEKKTIQKIACTLFRPNTSKMFVKSTEVMLAESTDPITAVYNSRISKKCGATFVLQTRTTENASSASIAGDGISFHSGKLAAGFGVEDFYDDGEKITDFILYRYQGVGGSCVSPRQYSLSDILDMMDWYNYYVKNEEWWSTYDKKDPYAPED